MKSVLEQITFKQAALLGCLFLTFSCVSCKEKQEELQTDKRSDDGVLIEKDFLWKSDISGKGLVWPALSPALYDGNIIMAGATELEKDMLVALDIKTGQEVWRWTDFSTIDHTAIINDSEYEINQKDNLWILEDSPYYYCIDLKTGTTVWKDKLDGQSGNSIQIVGNKYYTKFAFQRDSILIPSLIEGDLYSSEIKVVVEPPINPIQFFISFFGTMSAPFVYEQDGETHAFLQFTENVDLYASQSFNYIASYNLNSNQFDFEKTRIGDTMSLPFSQRPVMYENVMIINPDEVLLGIDKITGKVIWERKDFKNNGDGLLTYQLYNETLFAVNELGSTGRVIALDPLTGRTIWEDLGRGNSVHSLHFLNDVLYFTSRGDGKLYAYDTENGELLWRLNSPDVEIFQGYGGLRTVPGKDGEKGKVIASTYLNAYCFEAEK